jgi:hypothetical protein
LRSLFALSLAVPAYQFIMLFVDALMGLVLKYLLFGPLGGGASGATGAAGSAAYVAAAALAAAGSGGEVVVLAMVCYLVAYVFLAIYVAFKTPKLVAAFLKGAGAAGQFLSAFATGLIAGGAAAFATSAAAAGAGGLGGRWLGAGAAGAARAPRAGGAGPAGRPVLGAVAARALNPAPAAPAPGPAAPAAECPPAAGAGPWIETAAFGLRTFVDCLQADSPGEGAAIAFKALENHRKQQEKAAEARHKADLSAAKAAARPAARAAAAGRRKK